MYASNKLKVAFFIQDSLAENQSAETYLQEEYDPYYRLFLVISQAMNFNFEVLSFNTVGKKLANGSWTGAISLIKNLEADMVPNALLVKEERSEVLHYAYPFRFYPATFIIEKPAHSPQILGILRIFSLSTWITFALLAMSVTFLMFILMKKKYSLGDIILCVLAICLGQHLTLKAWTVRQNVLILGWMVGTLFLGFCYTSVLLSFLTVPPVQKIRDMRDLANAVVKNGYKCMYESFLIAGPTLLVDSRLKPLVSIGEHLMNSPNRFGNFDDFLRMKKSKVAYFNLVDNIPLLPDNYFVSEDYVLEVLNAMAVRKDFCCKEQLDRVIHTTMASGIYVKVKQDKRFLSGLRFRAETSSDQAEKSLTLSDLYLAFMVLLFGYLLSFAILVVEVFLGSNNLA